MDPLRIAVRTVLAYVFLLALLRVAGKKGLRNATAFEFVTALILGDLVDDALWAEVPFAQFIVAATTLMLAKLVSSLHKRLGVPRRA